MQQNDGTFIRRYFMQFYGFVWEGHEEIFLKYWAFTPKIYYGKEFTAPLGLYKYHSLLRFILQFRCGVVPSQGRIERT
jgi:hypothetical protein